MANAVGSSLAGFRCVNCGTEARFELGRWTAEFLEVFDQARFNLDPQGRAFMEPGPVGVWELSEARVALKERLEGKRR